MPAHKSQCQKTLIAQIQKSYRTDVPELIDNRLAADSAITWLVLASAKLRDKRSPLREREDFV